MFGMIILNHMNMKGNDICVKLKLFDRKIEEVDKIKFTAFYEEEIIRSIEINNIYGDDEYSSAFVCFDGLDINKKYKIIAECCVGDEWTECNKCFASTFTYNFQNNSVVYSEKLFPEDSPLISGLKFKEDYSFEDAMLHEISYEAVR